MILDKQQT